MHITLNGNQCEIAPHELLESMLKNFKINIQCCVILYNENIIDKNDISHIQLQENDVICCLSFVGGG